MSARRRRSTRPPARGRGPGGTRKRKQRVLVVGEGRATERNYFYGLRRQADENGIALIVRRGEGGTAVGVVEAAEQHLLKERRRSDGVDLAFCLMDTEGTDERARAGLTEAIRRAHDRDIRVVCSNPCFEIWLLAHFEPLGQVFEGCAGVTSRLSEIWRRQLNLDDGYDKSDPVLFERVSGKIGDAIRHASDTREGNNAQPWHIPRLSGTTDVHRLVDYLRGDRTDPPAGTTPDW